MRISNDVFVSGEPYSAYRARIMAEEGIMRDLLVASELILAEQEIDLTPFTALPKTVRVLVLSEDWCGDCTDNLPILNRLAEESGKLDVRIVSRDAHLEIMDAFLKYGKFRAIPLILFLDDDGEVIGRLIERPESVTELRARKKAEIYERHPEFGAPEAYATLDEETRAKLSEALMAMRDETRPFAIAEVVRELGEIAATITG
ncbi:MAG: thioredoxin family protein [Thermomicrobiales bacterium]|nr:thioredoxin family protein [Thermomicrobiales bacterium]